MAGRKKTGLEDVPNIISRPLYKDRFVWIGIATAIFWIALLYWLFF